MKLRANSSMIATWDYNFKSRNLIVTFKNGSNYQYFEVPPHDVIKVFGAPSIGKAFHRIIIPNYRYEKLCG